MYLVLHHAITDISSLIWVSNNDGCSLLMTKQGSFVTYDHLCHEVFVGAF